MDNLFKILDVTYILGVWNLLFSLLKFFELIIINIWVYFRPTKKWTFFFLRKSFNVWRPLLMIALYHQTKTSINFWCRQELNPRSLIQPSETLPVELTGTHPIYLSLFWFFLFSSFYYKFFTLSHSMHIFSIQKKVLSLSLSIFFFFHFL